jgi:hypothetical protein
MLQGEAIVQQAPRRPSSGCLDLPATPPPSKIGAEPVLELSDPRWNKLDDAYDIGGIPATLSRLAGSWDDQTAKSLMYETLCHQEVITKLPLCEDM